MLSACIKTVTSIDVYAEAFRIVRRYITLITLFPIAALAQPQASIVDTIDNAQVTKIALVIGNSHYKNIDSLRNPKNDAELVAAKLNKLGFTVILGRDTDFQQLKNLVREFVKQIQNDSVALFFYAGHGIQHEGENYLLPVDAEIKNAYEIEYFSVNLNMIIAALDQAAPLLSLAFVDACRNNPFKKRGLFRNGLSKSLGGLAAINSRAGSILSFATEPGNTAIDGIGSHSPYSIALAEKIATPGLSVQEMLNAVGLEVMKVTNGRQKPWYSSSPVAKFCFAGCLTHNRDQQVAQSLRDSAQQSKLRKIKQLAPVTQDLEATLQRHTLQRQKAVAGNKTRYGVALVQGRVSVDDPDGATASIMDLSAAAFIQLPLIRSMQLRLEMGQRNFVLPYDTIHIGQDVKSQYLDITLNRPFRAYHTTYWLGAGSAMLITQMQDRANQRNDLITSEYPNRRQTDVAMLLSAQVDLLEFRSNQLGVRANWQKSFQNGVNALDLGLYLAF